AEQDCVEAFGQIKNILVRSKEIAAYEPLSIRSSFGQGNWANVPWLAILDPKQTKAIQDGPYLVYLFRQDMSGFYLCFGYGISKTLKEYGKSQGKIELQKIVREI